MKKSLLNKIIRHILLIFLSAILLFGVLSCTGSIRRISRLTTGITKSVAQVAAQIASEYDIEELLENPDSTDYQELQAVLRSICKSEGLEYIYIYVPDMDKNKVTYVVSVSADDKENEKIGIERGAGEVVGHEVFDAEKNAWAGKTDGISYKYKNADYGEFISSFALIKDKDNNPVALAGADYSLDKINREIIYDTIWKMFIVLVALTGIFSLTALFVKKKIYNPITFLFEHMRNYISNKADDNTSFEPIKLNTNDEIQQLADFFNEMVEDMDKYVDKIKILVSEQAKADTELEVARRIQYGLVERKKNICLANDFVISARMQSARQVGGDFYDSFLLKNGAVCVCIGDVSGKGIAAAMFMAFVKTLIREKLMEIEDIAEAVNSANLEICNSNPEGMFVTAFIAIFEQNSNTFQYVNAGHNKPILIHNGKAEMVECETCMALGVFDDSEYEQGEHEFVDGDMLYLYTDGVTEAVNKERHFFGDENLLNACSLSEQTANDVCVSVVNALKKFIGDGAEQFDDITMLAVERRAPYLELACNLSELEKIKQYIFELPCDKSIKKKLYLACDEIFSNIVSYSSADYVRIHCSKEKDKISIIFEDNGKKFNSLESNTEKEFEDFDKGGMGIMLVKKLCSNILYNYVDEKNILTLEFTE